MIAYGFFLPAHDAINLRAKAEKLSTAEYLESLYYNGIANKDALYENPLKYWDETYHDYILENKAKNDNIVLLRGHNDGNENVVFVGALAIPEDNATRLDELTLEIDAKQVEENIENMGFSGYEPIYYFINEDKMNFDKITEKDIQRMSKNKLL